MCAAVLNARPFKSLERNEALAESLDLNPEESLIGFVGELREKKV